MSASDPGCVKTRTVPVGLKFHSTASIKANIAILSDHIRDQISKKFFEISPYGSAEVP